MTFDSPRDEVNFFEPVILPILPVVFGDFIVLDRVIYIVWM